MTPRARICLNMIVKDESATINRCLKSVLPVIDYYILCDTGSCDSTPEIIRSFFSENGISGELHLIPFVNFEVTRNLALDLCRRSPAEFDYILRVLPPLTLQALSTATSSLLTY